MHAINYLEFFEIEAYSNSRAKVICSSGRKIARYRRGSWTIKSSYNMILYRLILFRAEQIDYHSVPPRLTVKLEALSPLARSF
jgi:deoxycytidine triphosphate deaminase